MHTRILLPFLLLIPVACASPVDSNVFSGNGSGDGGRLLGGSGGAGGTSAGGGGGESHGVAGGGSGGGSAGPSSGGYGAGAGGSSSGGYGSGVGGAGGSGTGGAAGGGSGTSSVECTPCTSDAQCGDGQSAGCWFGDANGNPAYCAVDCTSGQACPAGSTCQQDSGDSYMTCIPDAGSCAGGSGGSGGASGAGSIQCAPCTSDATCGDGQSAGCWLTDANGSPAYCALDCTSSGSCPSGSTCVQDSGDPYMTCVPSSGDCSGGSGGSGGSAGGGSGGSGGGGTCSDTWASYAQTFFSSQCSSCHSWATSHSYVQSQSGGIASRISSGSMPPGGLSATDKQRILNYLNCGAP